MEKYITVIVAEKIHEPGSRFFLLAPPAYNLDINDEVTTLYGSEFRVVFSIPYATFNGDLYTALLKALGSPVKIVMHKAIKKVEWGDENESIAVSSPDNSTGRLGSEI